MGDIWPEGGDIVWLIRKPDLVGLLNKKAEHICELSEPLLKIREYRSAVAKVRRIVRPDGHPWISKSNVEWSYPKQLDEKIDELNSVDAGTQKPAETEQNTTPAKLQRIWTWVKRIPRWIYVLVIFLAALLTCIYLLWWLWTKFLA